MRLRVRLLGPVEVEVDERAVQLSGRLRTMLLVLAISAGKPVSLDRMVTAMWGRRLPDNPRGSVQTYVTRLRRVVGAATIGTEPTGYVLHAGPREVDALLFLDLLDTAATDDPVAERERLDQALTLWRGSPFEGSGSAWLEEFEAPRLVERYLSAVERRVDLDVAAGRLDGLAARLRELTARYRLRESLWVRLLTVLDHGGRQAEALEAYERVRRHIAEELGADPGPELRSFHARLLASGHGTAPRPATAPGSPIAPGSVAAPASAEGGPAAPGSAVVAWEAAREALAAPGSGGGLPSTPATAPHALPVVPRQLPADIPGFTGRDLALSTMDKLLGDGLGPLVVTAIGGAAGIGKTALAVHWAHHAADRFPDGQLYVNLRGFDPSGSPKEPSEVVRGFLDALRVPAQRVPSDLDSQVSLYRSLLAGKRMLVVLDNARDADQVRPLLPGAPGCLVVVTSRDRLLSLVAAEGAQPVVLDLLSPGEARQLLERRLGGERVAAEPEAVAAIVEACARLPLALAIVAAHAAASPGSRLGRLASELRHGLDAFDTASDLTDVRSVFSWSYRALSLPAARLFRLLGLHPGPDLSAPAAASLAGLSLPRARGLLSELTRANLITEYPQGRYHFHDLLRAYAAERADSDETAADRQAATVRVLNHYLRHADAANRLLIPVGDVLAVPGEGAPVQMEPLTDRAQALEWFRTEHRVVERIVQLSATGGFDEWTGQLARAVCGFLDLQGRWPELVTTQHAALTAAVRLGDLTGQAGAHRRLSRACSRLGRFGEAESHLRRALELSRRQGDHGSQGRAHIHLGFLFERQGRYADALEEVSQALDLYRLAGDRRGEAMARNGIGWFQSQLGDYGQALVSCQQALRIHREIGNNNGEASTSDSIGYIYHQLGDYDRAKACYERALELYTDLDNRFSTADTLTRLGDTHQACDDPAAARVAWRRAVDIFTELGQPMADHVRARIDALSIDPP